MPEAARSPGARPLDGVGRAAVLRGFVPVGHAVVANNARDAQAVIGKHARAPERLRLAVARKVAPAPHCFLVAPERKGQQLALVGKAREALYGDESVDFLELRPQLRGELQILLFPARSRNDLEYHCEHVVVLRYRLRPSSARMSFAPSTIAFIFPNAASRGKYFIPQSGATTTRSGATKGRARRMRAATFSGVSTVTSFKSITPRMIVLAGRDSSTEQSRLDCAVSIETWRQLQPASSPRNE